MSIRVPETIVVRKFLVALLSSFAGISVLLPMIGDLGPWRAIPSFYLVSYLPLIVLSSWQLLLSNRLFHSFGLPALLLLHAVGFLWTPNEQLYSAAILSLTTLGAVAYVGVIRDERDWRTASRIFSVASCCTCIILLVTYVHPIHPGREGGGRLGAVFGSQGIRIIEPNQVGTFCGFSMLVVVAALSDYPDLNKVLRKFLWLTLVLNLVTLLLSQSRGALAATIGALLVMVVGGRALLSVKGWGALLVAATGAVFVIALAGSSILERFSSASAGTFGGRTEIWSEAIALMSSSWTQLAFGSGTAGGPRDLGRFAPYLADFLNVSAYSRTDELLPSINPHNSVLELALNFGLFGVFVAALALAEAFLRARKVDRGCQLALAQGFVAFFLLTSISLVAYRLVGISIGCGGMALACLYRNGAVANPNPIRVGRTGTEYGESN